MAAIKARLGSQVSVKGTSTSGRVTDMRKLHTGQRGRPSTVVAVLHADGSTGEYALRQVRVIPDASV